MVILFVFFKFFHIPLDSVNLYEFLSFYHRVHFIFFFNIHFVLDI